jgi:ClpP class serine protease
MRSEGEEGGMTVSDLFWLFFLLMMLQPLLRQKALELARVRQLKRIEAARGARAITLIHRQVSMAFLGFPIMRFIDINDSEEVIRAVHLTDKETPIDLIVHAPGGLALASLQIAHVIRAHPAKVTVHVPHYAMSGATLIALAADEIVMDDHAVLGPVDPQVGSYPAASILAAVARKNPDEVDDQTLILADLAEKAIAQTQGAVKTLLLDHMPEADAERIAVTLSGGTWTHDHPLTAEVARLLGLPVVAGLDPAVYELMRLYPQPVRQQPAVEYLPSRPAPPPVPSRR